MNMASILGIAKPSLLPKNIISVILPNETMKKELLQHKAIILEYLRKNMNNYDIEMQVVVNKEEAKKYIFLPEEKYVKLKEINSDIDFLKTTFDLRDIS